MQKLEAALYQLTTETAKPTGVRDRVKTFEDACRETDCYPENITVSGIGLDEKELKALAAYQKLFVVAKALNEGWVPDWNNGNQYKYYPWFNMENGFAFVVYVFSYRRRISYVGSRLCFKSRELAEYAGKQFIHLYEQVMVL